MHWQRWRKHGDPLHERATLEERFWAKVDKTETCWLWTASKDRTGYGKFGVGSGWEAARRVAYRLTVGPVPDGREIDHKCRIRACVNPGHLHAVTSQGNGENLGGAYRRSVTQVRGVTREKRTGLYAVRANAGGRTYWGGRFEALADAEAAAIALRNRVMTNNLADRQG